MSRLKKLIHEVHRRSLWQVLGIYLVGSWAAVQIVQALVESLGLPIWFSALAVVLLIVGFPIVLATAFVQEGTPSGRGEPADDVPDIEAPGRGEGAAARTEPAHPVTGLLTWRNAIGGGVLAFALFGVLAAGWLILGPGPTALVAGRDDASDTGPDRKSIAVLPFTNMNQDEENRFFTDGIHEDILAQLSKIGDLKVISRTSVMEYRDRRENLRAIADELGVATVLEGTVRRAGDRVRVVAQLIDAETDEHLWADTYDRTVTDIFAIQSDIAARIAEALATSLAPATAQAAEAPPTESFEAYEHYLKGTDHLNLVASRMEAFNAERAVEEFERAVELDPSFAAAWARLSLARRSAVAAVAWMGVSVSRMVQRQPLVAGILPAAERALELDPELADAHFAMYRALEETRPDDALPHLERALELAPNNAEMLRELSREQRARDQWEAAYGTAVKAAELDPRSAFNHWVAGQTARYMRRFGESERYLDRALVLATDDPVGLDAIYRQKIWLELARGGGVEGAQRVFREERSRHQPDSASLRVRFVEFPELLVGGEFDDLIESYAPDAEDPELRCTCYYQKAMMHRVAGRQEMARPYFDSLVAERAAGMPEFTIRFDEAGWRALQARDYVRAGRVDEGVAELERAMAIDIDAFDALLIRRRRAQFYAELGDAEKAVEDLEDLLSVPSMVTVHTLRAKQAWMPVRDHPAFQALIARWEGRQ